jgi:hypothetical protein
MVPSQIVLHEMIDWLAAEAVQVHQEDFTPDLEKSTEMSFFLDAEIELADEFLVDAKTYIQTGLHTAARESLQNAEAALQIIERCLGPWKSFQEAGGYITLIRERRQRALLMQQWIPVRFPA